MIPLALAAAGGHSVRQARAGDGGNGSARRRARHRRRLQPPKTLFRPGYTEPVDLPTVYLSVAVLILVIGLAVVALSWRPVAGWRRDTRCDNPLREDGRRARHPRWPRARRAVPRPPAGEARPRSRLPQDRRPLCRGGHHIGLDPGADALRRRRGRARRRGRSAGCTAPTGLRRRHVAGSARQARPHHAAGSPAATRCR